MDQYSKQEEKELIVRLSEGDSATFEKIYYLYVKRVFHFAKRYVYNDTDAEEIVQEVFTKLWENRHNINPDLSFSGYILTITKNTIFNDNRKKVNHQAYCSYVINYLQKNTQNIEDEIIFKDICDLLNDTIEKLPAKRQEIFKLSRQQGLSYKEIAEKLNISEKTIETHMRLALRDIKKVIAPLIDQII
ncbi:MAG: RNA polymerase sigma-70 factor [Bacteroidales bacterium]|nr:RNA polymerase sigma-70 factor [Bacteroidales bacterium]